MKKIVVLTILVIFYLQSFAQTADDALRYSQNFYEGSARSMAMGNAFGALGADFSVASTNPAGLGLYRGFEFSITPELNFRNTESTYYGTHELDNKAVFDLGSIAYVSSQKLFSAKKSDWKYYQFSFGMNRLNNFNTQLNMVGDNPNSSKMDAYLALANGTPYNQIEDDPNGVNAFDLKPAWDLYLLDTIPGTIDQYYSPVPPGGISQREQVNTSGSINEYSFSISGNYNDFLYLGASIGMPHIRYFYQSVFSETDVADTIPTFNSWSYKQNLQTIGWGINLKLGAIVRPLPWLRIGAAFHSPTYYYNMHDTWSSTTSANLPGLDPQQITPPTANFSYVLTTPFKAIGSVGITLLQQGALSFEYEYTNYSSSRFSADQADFSSTNSDISKSYGAGNNFRAGAEWRFGSVSLRGGYALYSSPYKNNLKNGKRQLLSGGIGFSAKGFNLDFAYVHATWNQDYYMYNFWNLKPVNQAYKNNQFVATLKFRF